MNYEFHMGDYVETRDGKVGYIYYFGPNILVFKIPDGSQYEIHTDVLDWSNHPEYVFKRIGAYDFTKKENKKIENLTKPQWSMPVEDLIDKINELVDAVNKLMDKENNV